MKKRPFLSFVILSLAVACQPRVNSRGNVTVVENFESFVIGKSTTREILEKCGTPFLHRDNFTWIYIYEKSEEIAFKEIELKDRLIIRMRFDQNKILKSIEKINLKDGGDILMNEEFTSLISEKRAENQVDNALHKSS